MSARSDQRYPMSGSAVRYAWRELARRAGLRRLPRQGAEGAAASGGMSGLSVVYGNPDDVGGSQELLGCGPGDTNPARRIVITPCESDDWHSLLRHQPPARQPVPGTSTVPSGATPPFEGAMPVPFWGTGSKSDRPFVERRSDGSVVFHADILATTLFFLSRWEEMESTDRDAHDRFPAWASVAHRDGYLHLPVVDLYALILRSWIEEVLPGWRPEPRRFAVELSHDVDHVCRFPTAWSAIRALGADILKNRSVGRAVETAVHYLASRVDPANDAYLAAIRHLADISQEHGLSSEFMFMASERGLHSSGYDPATLAEIAGYLDRHGHQVGFHAGYGTFDDPELLKAEKRRLEEALAMPVSGGRQHYLRFRVPETWQHWELAGFTYDSTLGFPEHEGFRCGTCHFYRPYDISRDRELTIEERPLVAMDTTFRLSRGMTPMQAERRILDLAAMCRRVEGTFTLLWHNSSLAGDWREWAPMYQRVVGRLGEMV